MAGLCEGGNEPPDSLKANVDVCKTLSCDNIKDLWGKLRKRLVKCFVWNVTFYGTETWTLRRSEEKRLEAFEMWIWRKMEHVKWTDRIRNKAVLERQEKTPLVPSDTRSKSVGESSSRLTGFIAADDTAPPPIPPPPANYHSSSVSRVSEDSYSEPEEDSRATALSTPTHDTGSSVDGIAGSLNRRHSKMNRRIARQAQLKRLRMAQEVQRQLEELEVKQRELEQRGVSVEKALRGEGTDSEGKEEPELLREWFDLMRERTELRRYERELMVRAQEMELEDRHARLQHELRERMSKDGEKQLLYIHVVINITTKFENSWLFPFIPLEDIENTFDLLYDDINEDLVDLSEYIQNTYVRGRRARGRRRSVPAWFLPPNWNMYKLTLQGHQRTNNAVEAFCNKFQKMVAAQLSIWRLIQIKDEQHENEIVIYQIRVGHRNIRPPVNKTYQTNKQRIEAIVRRYHEYKDRNDIKLYLRAISYHLKIYGQSEEEGQDQEME
ncbi:hypothetical protein ANN_21836 [Periplaneta americana]|uniref:BMERB domain-containing protein n=1 Tax=Periplaneta americana TaxID=6978 RepID=A0ABQ8S6Y7_PERAM|nr:hypothetical protein ANN_21836 [Periplaneta americana]